MKINRLQKRAAAAVALLAGTALAASAFAAQADKTQEKINLMVTAVQARDSGDLKAAKQALEELVKIAPNDEGVQRMLSDVNSDIERQSKGEAPVLVGAKMPQPAQKVESGDQVAEASEAKATPVDAAMAESLRKLQLSIIAAYDLIDESYDLMDEGKWADAEQKLAFAESKIGAHEYNPLSDDVRAEIKRAKAVMAKERTQIAMAERNVAGAQKHLEEYAASEEDAAKANKLKSEVEKFSDNPKSYTLADVSPEFAARQAKVKVLLEKGRRQYLYGDFQGARATFRSIETLDANNVEAKAYQRLISEKLSTTSRLSYLATRESMLNEVENAWTRPQVYTGNTTGSDNQKITSVIDAKLRDIIIPNISFPDPGVPLAQAINTLSVLSVDYDKSNDAKKGVNIVLFDGAGESKNVILTLRDLSLGQILDWVTQQAGYQYDVEKDTVVVRKATGETGATMETMDFSMSLPAVQRIAGGPKAGASAGDDPFGGGGGSGTAGGGDANRDEAIKNFLIKAGVQFGPGSSVTWLEGKLWVCNTRRNLDKIRTILLRFSEVKQVEIESKFMEVNQGALKELGFNWNVANASGRTLFSTVNRDTSGSISYYNNRRLSGAGSSSSTGNTINVVTDPLYYQDSTGAISILDKGGNKPIDTLFPVLPSTINTALGAGSTVDALLGVVNGYDIDFIVNAIEQKQGTDLLCSPKVTVLSGMTATITVSQQMRYPESWGDVQSNVGTSSSSSLTGSSAGVTITPGTPQDFQTYDVGVVMDVNPTADDDGTINLKFSSVRVTEFEGFMEYGGVALAISSGTTVTVPSGFIQPVFSVREIRTEVTVFDGATVVMGGLTREEVRTVDDQVPILGDIPVIGRLFQSKGETRQKRNLLIFVTANTISPGGSVGREQFQEMRPGSVYQNPTIISPGGSVQRILEDSNEAEQEK